MKSYWLVQQCDVCKKDICRFLCAWEDVQIPTICLECWKDTYPEAIESP